MEHITLKKYMNCSNCGHSALITNKRTCSSKKSGKVCGGNIHWVKGTLVRTTDNWKILGMWKVKDKTWTHK